MNEIGTYGVYTVDKIMEFLTNKLAFDKPELANVLDKMLTKDDFRFTLTYDMSTDVYSQYWDNKTPSDKQLEYIEMFNHNNLTPKYDTPVILPKYSRKFTLDIDDQRGIVDKLKSNTIVLRPETTLYLPSFSPDPESPQKNYWFSLDYTQAAGYIQTKAFENRTNRRNNCWRHVHTQS